MFFENVFWNCDLGAWSMQHFSCRCVLPKPVNFKSVHVMSGMLRIMSTLHCDRVCARVCVSQLKIMGSQLTAVKFYVLAPAIIASVQARLQGLSILFSRVLTMTTNHVRERWIDCLVSWSIFFCRVVPTFSFHKDSGSFPRTQAFIAAYSSHAWTTATVVRQTMTVYTTWTPATLASWFGHECNGSRACVYGDGDLVIVSFSSDWPAKCARSPRLQMSTGSGRAFGRLPVIKALVRCRRNFLGIVL